MFAYQRLARSLARSLDEGLASASAFRWPSRYCRMTESVFDAMEYNCTILLLDLPSLRHSYHLGKTAPRSLRTVGDQSSHNRLLVRSSVSHVHCPMSQTITRATSPNCVLRCFRIACSRSCSREGHDMTWHDMAKHDIIDMTWYISRCAFLTRLSVWALVL